MTRQKRLQIRLWGWKRTITYCGLAQRKAVLQEVERVRQRQDEPTDAGRTRIWNRLHRLSGSKPSGHGLTRKVRSAGGKARAAQLTSKDQRAAAAHPRRTFKLDGLELASLRRFVQWRRQNKGCRTMTGKGPPLRRAELYVLGTCHFCHVRRPWDKSAVELCHKLRSAQTEVALANTMLFAKLPKCLRCTSSKALPSSLNLKP